MIEAPVGDGKKDGEEIERKLHERRDMDDSAKKKNGQRMTKKTQRKKNYRFRFLGCKDAAFFSA